MKMVTAEGKTVVATIRLSREGVPQRQQRSSDVPHGLVGPDPMLVGENAIPITTPKGDSR